MKFTGPKAKRCRRHGVNLYGSDKYDTILQRKPSKPGKAPKTRLGKQSEFALQLQEKQKTRDIYGLSEKQFRRFYEQALQSKGATGDTLCQLLERRLDNILFRSGFALTRLQGRQFASHGLFFVNGTRVTCPSYLLKIGDILTVRQQSKNSPVFAQNASLYNKSLAPQWIAVDMAALSAKIVALPTPEDAEQGIDTRQVIEFYSR